MIIRPAKQIRGRVAISGDKSISHRAAILAALSEGTSRIKNFSTSEDCQATLRCLEQLGVAITRERADVVVRGVGREGFRAPKAQLDCGNSGTTMRLLAGILAGQEFASTLTGDDSLRARPMQRIIEPLQMMGVEINSNDGRAPLTIRGRKPLNAIDYELLTPSAQVKSCILLAGLQANGRTKVVEDQPTRDHTERMLRSFGGSIETGQGEKENERVISVDGPIAFAARDIDVPGDISSAAYFIAAAALLDNSALEINDVGLNPTRTLFLKQMQSFGLAVSISDVRDESNEPRGTILVEGSRASLPVDSESLLTLHSALIPQLIDELPLLAIVGSQIKGGIEIRGARELRVKESDRIAATVAGLQAMGAEVEEFDDGLRINGPTRLCGARIDPRGDHRIAMTFAVAGLIADGETQIRDAECVAVSFPKFFDLLDSVVER